MKVADKIVYGIKTPDEALDLMESVIKQYFGEYWTEHKPLCPLCNSGLSDTAKHMNRPVGECTHTTCDTTIYISDYLGKMKDLLNEWNLQKETWKENTYKELLAKVKSEMKTSSQTQVKPQATPHASDVDISLINADTVFVW